jgi:hypothetical protein
MVTFLIAFISLAVLLGSFAYITMPASSGVRRGVVSICFAVILCGLFFGYSDMLGRPKASQLEILRGATGEARILGSFMKEGEGIYLWLQLAEADEPRYYKLPWSDKLAKALQQAVEKNAEQKGPGVAMRMPFEADDRANEEPRFYPLPQPKLADKPSEGRKPPVMVYQAPEQRS